LNDRTQLVRKLEFAPVRDMRDQSMGLFFVITLPLCQTEQELL
jgi:hypothetical protein